MRWFTLEVNHVVHYAVQVNEATVLARRRHPVLMSSEHEDGHQSAGYHRSRGSPRGEARRQLLLEKVTRDLAVNGLADFSLRRAARAAGTTHKVLLYHFDGAEDLLQQSVSRLREQRISDGLAAARQHRGSLGARVRAMWPTLINDEIAPVLDQAIGLAMADPQRYASLGRGSSEHFLPHLMAICPSAWSDQRRREVAQMTFATLRGFLVEWRTTGDGVGIEAGLDALVRALDREEQSTE